MGSTFEELIRSKPEATSSSSNENDNWSLTHAPSDYEITKLLNIAPDSASGPDGLPYCKWRETGETGASTLNHAMQDLVYNIPISIEFNDSASIFPAKGDLEDDKFEIVRGSE